MSDNKKAIEDTSENSRSKDILLLVKKEGINHKDEDGSTPLIKACDAGLNSLVFHLIREGADINVKDKNGRSPLGIALEKGNYDLAVTLINHGANIAVFVNSTVLPNEFFKKNPHLVKYLSPNGVNSSVLKVNDISIFVSDKASLEAMKSYIQGGGNVDAANAQKQTFLMMASDAGNVETVKYLIEKGANLNAQDEKGNTALMFSAKKGSVEIAELLLENKADVNMKNIDEKTAIMMSVEEKHIEVTKTLVKYNADITLKDKDGENVLMKASKNGSLDAVKLFIEECCEEEVKGSIPQNEQETLKTKPLDPIVSKKAPVASKSMEASPEIENIVREVPKEKISLSKFINEQDNNGLTALMHAYQNKQVDVFKYLLEKNADISIKNKEGQSVLDAVYKEKDIRFTNLLEKTQSELAASFSRINSLREAMNIRTSDKKPDSPKIIKLNPQQYEIMSNVNTHKRA